MNVEYNKMFVSSVDGLEIHYNVYEPGDNDKGIVIQGMHGMAEHKERYDAFGKYLAENGYTFVMCAHRGHKGAVKSPEDYGYMGVDGLNNAREDGNTLTGIIKQQYPNKKLILFGHSMGSLIARLYFQKYADNLDGLILCGAPADNPASKAGVMMAKLVKTLRGARHRSNLLNGLAFGNNNSRTEKRTVYDWLSVNQKNVDEYIKDDACGYTFTAQSFVDLMQGMVDVYSDYPKPLKNENCPVLFIAGKEDPCGNYGDGVVAAKQHMENQGVKHVEIKLYDNMRHEILNEENWEDVLKDIVDFINNTVAVNA
ncbi:MAG: lysophospholipase [Erysipelotrichales bacterium]|nr:lysophospholipase [Erysipelotrichales bacterium]